MSFPIRECFNKQKTSLKFDKPLIHLHRSKRQKETAVTKTCNNKHLSNFN